MSKELDEEQTRQIFADGFQKLSEEQKQEVLSLIMDGLKIAVLDYLTPAESPAPIRIE